MELILIKVVIILITSEFSLTLPTFNPNHKPILFELPTKQPTTKIPIRSITSGQQLLSRIDDFDDAEYLDPREKRTLQRKLDALIKYMWQTHQEQQRKVQQKEQHREQEQQKQKQNFNKFQSNSFQVPMMIGIPVTMNPLNIGYPNQSTLSQFQQHQQNHLPAGIASRFADYNKKDNPPSQALFMYPFSYLLNNQNTLGSNNGRLSSGQQQQAYPLNLLRNQYPYFSQQFSMMQTTKPSGGQNFPKSPRPIATNTNQKNLAMTSHPNIKNKNHSYKFITNSMKQQSLNHAKNIQSEKSNSTNQMNVEPVTVVLQNKM